MIKLTRERVVFMALVLALGAASGFALWIGGLALHNVEPHHAPAVAGDTVSVEMPEEPPAEPVKPEGLLPATAVRFDRAPAIATAYRHFFSRLVGDETVVYAYDPVSLQKVEMFRVAPGITEDGEILLPGKEQLTQRLAASGIMLAAERTPADDGASALAVLGYEGSVSLSDDPILDFVPSADGRSVYLLTSRDVRQYDAALRTVRVVTPLPESTFEWSGLQEGGDGYLRLVGEFDNDDWFTSGGRRYFLIDKLAGKMIAMTPVVPGGEIEFLGMEK